MNTSPEHRMLQEQWTMDWSLPVESQIFAYSPVLLLAIWYLWRSRKHGFFLKDPRVAFLCTWFLVSLVLANHELIFRAHQPLHFTRGYIWIPLFLLAAKQITLIIDRVLANKNRVLRLLMMGSLIILLLADNSIWFGSHLFLAVSGKKPVGFYLTDSGKEVFSLMNAPENRDAMVISSDHLIGYLTTVYSPLRSWASHGVNTPDYWGRVDEIQTFFENGVVQRDWEGRKLVVVSLASFDHQWRRNILRNGLKPRLRTEKYVVYTGIIFP